MWSEHGVYWAFRAEPFEQQFLQLPRSVAENRWREIIMLALRAQGRASDAEIPPYYLSDRFAPRGGAGRRLEPEDPNDLWELLHQACEGACAAGRWKAEFPKSPAGLFEEYPDPRCFAEVLPDEEAQLAWTAWRRLCATLGVIHSPAGRRNKPPWWAGDPGSYYLGLTTPGQLRDLAQGLAESRILDTVAALARDSYPEGVRDLQTLAAFIVEVAPRSCWLLARQAPS